jgi:GLPGLI family protein
MPQKLFHFIFIFCCYIILSNHIGAQPTSQYDDLRRYIGKGGVIVMDSAKLRITYSLQYAPDSAKSQQMLKDRKILLIGNKLSHFYSHYIRQADSALTADWDKGKSSAPLKWPADVRGEGYDIYFGFNSGVQTVLEPITGLSTYRYEESVTPQWIIGSETDTVLSYPCQKATTHFRGRDWTVWFTMDIPLNAGPWKLRGLPGLILKAADSRGHYVFDCTGIEQLRQKQQPIIMIRTRHINCSREEYRKVQKQFYENYVNALLALGYNVYVRDDSGKTIETLATPNKEFEERNVMWSMNVSVADRHRKIPYNPIELE